MCCHGYNINDFKKYQVEKVTVLRIIINGLSNFHFNFTIPSSNIFRLTNYLCIFDNCLNFKIGR